MTQTERLHGRLSTHDIVNALASCPAFEGLSRECLLPLAGCVELRSYEPLEMLLTGNADESGPLSILCFGQLFWGSERYPEQQGAWVLTPGAVYGLRALNEWTAVGNPGRWTGAPPRVRAQAQSRIWVYELAPCKFGEVFAHPDSQPLLDALLALYPVNLHAPEIVRAMRQSSQFARVASTRLYELLQRATTITAEQLPAAAPPSPGQNPNQELAQAARPSDPAASGMHYVLSGEVEVSFANETGLTLRRGDMHGTGELFTDQSQTKTLRNTAPGTRLVRLSESAMRSALSRSPAMAMMMGPAARTASECPDGGAPSYPLLAQATLSMVLADQAVDRSNLDLPAAVDGLAQALEADFSERVWILHIVPEPAPPTPSLGLFSPPKFIEVPAAANVEVFVHAALEKFGRRYGLFFDEILVEASALDPFGLDNDALWAAMLNLPFPSRVDYMVSEAQQWEQIPDAFLNLNLSMGIAVQPVALLEPLGDIAPLYALSQEIGDYLAGASNLTTLLTKLPGQLRDLVERWVVVATQVYGSAYFMPEPWPLDAVRLRLAPTATSPTPEQLAAAEASYSRWGRAATSRRVGLAVGGAGALSFVGIPFIRALMANKVPIDILSGASAGSYVGAFFSAMGSKGLTRLEWSWPALEVGVLLALFNNFPVTWWLAWATQYADLSNVNLPVISVSTFASTGDPFQQSAGLVGKSLVASGSIPPLVSTFIGNQRLLDGGLSQDVPTAVLDAAGANLNLGIQPVAKPLPLPGIPDFVPVPVWKKWLITFNPALRLFDAIRGYEMMFRQAAFAQDQYADVFYVATTRFASAGFFWQVPRIIAQAENSASLQDAVSDTVKLWQQLEKLPPGRLRVDPLTGAVELGTALVMQGTLSSPTNFELIAYTRRILASLAETTFLFPAHKLEVTVIWNGSSLPGLPARTAAETTVEAAAKDGAPTLPSAQLIITHSSNPALLQPGLSALLSPI